MNVVAYAAPAEVLLGSTSCWTAANGRVDAVLTCASTTRPVLGNAPAPESPTYPANKQPSVCASLLRFVQCVLFYFLVKQ
jgi:hypothetical protein